MFNNKRVIAFCDLHTTPTIPGLNDKRSLGTVAFLGRFAIMDFTLSNFSNSGIDRVGILVHRFPHSVLSHIENGQPWISNSKTGFQYIMYNEEGIKKPSFNTDIENILVNRALFEREQCDIIVIAPAYYLTSMDFRPIIDEHIKNNANVTAIYSKINNGKNEFVHSRLVELNEDGTAKRFVRNTKRKDKVNVSLDTFIINKETFDEIIKNNIHLSRSSALRDFIAGLVAREEIVVHTHNFDGLVIPILSLEDYFNNSFACLKYEYRCRLFKPDWPIYTTSHDTPPAKYGPHAEAENSIISNGSIINGKVRNSIVSRNVTIDEGAEVDHAILFTYTHVHSKIKVTYAVSEKHVEVTESVKGKVSDLKVISGKKSK
jgi:glucose-1-phosphate adenylyltransferase